MWIIITLQFYRLFQIVDISRKKNSVVDDFNRWLKLYENITVRAKNAQDSF